MNIYQTFGYMLVCSKLSVLSVIISLALIVVAGVVELWDLVAYILMKLLWLLKTLPINVD